MRERIEHPERPVPRRPREEPAMAPAGLLALQRSAGNHATVRAIQRMRITIDPAWFPQPQPQQGAVAVQTPPAQVIDTATMDRHQLHQLFAQLLNQYAQDQNIHVIAAALEVDQAIRTGDYRNNLFFGLPPTIVQRLAAVCQAVLGSPNAPPIERGQMHDVESRAERKASNEYGGDIQSVMTLQEQQGLVSLCQALLKARPPAQFAYIMLGNSVAPLVGCLGALFTPRNPAITVIPLPISELDATAQQSWNDPTQRGRMMTHIGQFVSVQRLGGRRPVCVDITGSGTSPRIAQWLLTQFFQELQSPQVVEIQLLNQQDRADDMPGLGPTGDHPEHQAALQHEILQRVLKDEMLFRMWQRTPMGNIFRGDAPPPTLLLAEFERMMLDIIKLPYVLQEIQRIG